MGSEFIRIWVEEDVEQLSKQLLIVGESFSDCGKMASPKSLLLRFVMVSYRRWRRV